MRDAVNIVNERLASGEISVEEHRQILEALEPTSSPQSTEYASKDEWPSPMFSAIMLGITYVLTQATAGDVHPFVTGTFTLILIGGVIVFFISIGVSMRQKGKTKIAD